VLRESPKAEQRRFLRIITGNQKKMRTWARHAPMNYLHRFSLVEAERHRVLGHTTKARDLYDQAIALAREHNYPHEEALAYELAAKFYLATGKQHVARAYMQEAWSGYAHWGAMAKARDLEACHPQLLPKTMTMTASETAIVTSTTVTTSQLSRISLDVVSVMKALQSLSSEIVLDKLLEKLMAIVMENAGAQQGFLVLQHDSGLLIQAHGVVETGDMVVLQALPIREEHGKPSPALPTALLHYVARTKEPVVLHDASHEGPFITEP